MSLNQNINDRTRETLRNVQGFVVRFNAIVTYKVDS